MAQIPWLPAKKKFYLSIFWTFDLCADPLVGWELAVLDVNRSRRLRVGTLNL